MVGWLVSLVERERGCVTWAGFYCHCRVRDYTTPTIEPPGFKLNIDEALSLYVACEIGHGFRRPAIMNAGRRKRRPHYVLVSSIIHAILGNDLICF